jgi:argininosuccinate lyase
MKLWTDHKGIDEVVEKFTVGEDRELDLQLARYDVLGSIAHAEMLQAAGLISREELAGLKEALSDILRELEEGRFSIGIDFEDVHSKVEHELTHRVGEAGKKIHTARSRNDQVLLDLHLYARDEVGEIKAAVREVFERLMDLSERHGDVPMPGYTHMQIAMLSSFGMWFGAYAEMLVDDIAMLNAAYRIADQNPLGSAAGYGSSFPIDRSATTDSLGFSTMRYNAMGAGMSRGRLEWHVASALASVATTIGRFAMDVVLYSGGNFGFVRLPDELTTGSSIMPHKKNPDLFELLRARCNVIRALPNEIALLTGNLPGGYHRDYQLLKESLFPAVVSLKDCLTLTAYALDRIEVVAEWQDDARYEDLYTVEEVNRLVSEGVPFREAYRTVSDAVRNGTFQRGEPAHYTHQGSIGNLCHPEIRDKFERAYRL